jgi:hypothetical protein
MLGWMDGARGMMMMMMGDDGWVRVVKRDK